MHRQTKNADTGGKRKKEKKKKEKKTPHEWVVKMDVTFLPLNLL
jgi:hypothetical protein